jgi:hypothetical protein
LAEQSNLRFVVATFDSWQQLSHALRDANMRGLVLQTARPRDTWKRALFVLLLAIALGIAQLILNMVAVVQFFWLLFTNGPNRFLLSFGRSCRLGSPMSPAS